MGFVGENVKILFKAAGSKYAKYYLQFCLFHCVFIQFKVLFCLWCPLLVNKTFICSYPWNAQSSGKSLSLNCRARAAYDQQGKKKTCSVVLFFFFPNKATMFINYRKGMNPVCRLCNQGKGKGKRFNRHQPAASADVWVFPAVTFLLSLLWCFCQHWQWQSLPGLLLMASIQCGVRRGVREQEQGQTAGFRAAPPSPGSQWNSRSPRALSGAGTNSLNSLLQKS